ncbi:dihydrodiol dehydrogenase [Phytoactinopolyspora sp. XMNu-373]|uniref:Dihydrodiol dehydrogenase n=1 Tax=Phytoactinopolyspora mesophila TaxID=2650750 RepID=A0A7K3MBL6_9ACTN|nr:dihydrodiol dehydrogenase [Phytoactinopolyspora mesophila]
MLDEVPRDGGVEGPIVIANEFADVVVTRVHTRNGVRLDIWSPRRGTRVQLDAVELDCLSYQEPETFTEMLERKPGG